MAALALCLVAGASVAALGEGRPLFGVARAELEKAMQDLRYSPDEEVSMAAAEFLGKIGGDDDDAKAALVGVLRGWGANLKITRNARCSAATALGKIAGKDKDAMAALVGALRGGPGPYPEWGAAAKDSYWKVRVSAAEALVQTGGDDARAALVGALRGQGTGAPADTDAAVRAKAAECLGEIDGGKEVKMALADAASHQIEENSGVRKAATKALGKFAGNDAWAQRVLFATFCGRRPDPDFEIGIVAKKALLTVAKKALLIQADKKNEGKTPDEWLRRRLEGRLQKALGRRPRGSAMGLDERLRRLEAKMEKALRSEDNEIARHPGDRYEIQDEDEHADQDRQEDAWLLNELLEALKKKMELMEIFTTKGLTQDWNAAQMMAIFMEEGLTQEQAQEYVALYMQKRQALRAQQAQAKQAQALQAQQAAAAQLMTIFTTKGLTQDWNAAQLMAIFMEEIKGLTQEQAQQYVAQCMQKRQEAMRKQREAEEAKEPDRRRREAEEADRRKFEAEDSKYKKMDKHSKKIKKEDKPQRKRKSIRNQKQEPETPALLRGGMTFE